MTNGVGGQPSYYSETVETANRPNQNQIADNGAVAVSFDIVYLILALCLALICAVAGTGIDAVDQKVVPRGDAFSYSMVIYEILNTTHDSFIAGLKYVVMSGNFIWLQHLLVLVFSPFLSNHRGSLIFINYFSFFITTIVVFRTALLSRVPHFWAFVVTLIFAAMPWNYQALMQFSRTSLMPEPVFTDAFVCTILLSCWWIADPYSKKKALALGLALGAAIWSRGNAFMYLAIPFAGFALAGVARFVWPKRRLNTRTVKTFGIAFLTSVVMAASYFYFTHHSIYEYYLDHATSVQFDSTRKLAGSEWILLNMPGLAIAGRWIPTNVHGTHYYAFALTLCGHAIVLYSAISGVRKIAFGASDEVLIGALGIIGAATFYLYTLFALVTFSGYYSEVEIRTLHPFEPALLGFACCALSVLCGLLGWYPVPRVRHPLPYTAAGALFAFSAIAITRSSLAAIIDADGWPAYGFRAAAVADDLPCRSLNEISDSYLPSKAISQLSLLLAKEAAGKRVYFFWYGVFNQQIVEYYTAQNEVKPVIEVPLRSEDDSKYWFWTFNPELVTTRSSFREFLNYLFARADFIVIPERLEAFQIMWASPITGYHEEIAAALNSREVAPDYEVWAVVDEGPSTRVLILRRRPSHAPDSGLEHFPRTWGSSDQIIGRGFKGAIEVTQRPWWEDDAATPPRLLYAYNGYNLIRLGRLYIAAAHDLGPMDITPVLTGAAPRPPSRKFIAARDISQLKRAVDACGVANGTAKLDTSDVTVSHSH